MHPNPPPSFAEVYEQLRGIARRKLASLPPGQTLQATALVHEAWLKIAAADGSRIPEDPEHLRAMTAQAMRWILVDRARRRGVRPRRGEGLAQDEIAVDPDQGDEDWEGLSRALEALERLDPRRSKVVMLRFFGGLSVEETAASLDLSPATVKRDWQFARAWILRTMTGESPEI